VILDVRRIDLPDVHRVRSADEGGTTSTTDAAALDTWLGVDPIGYAFQGSLGIGVRQLGTRGAWTVRHAEPGSVIGKLVARTDDPRWKPWKVAIAAVAIQHLIVFTVAYAANSPATSLFHVKPVSGLDLLDQWDAQRFLSVARYGYTTSPGHPQNTEAFFPLFPLLVRGVMALGMGPVAAALAINTLALVVACRYLYELAEDSLDTGLATRTVLFLVLFPTSLFLVVPYSESLFLLGTVTSFLFARRGRWLPAGIGAAVAVASRPLGIFLVVGLVVDFVRQKEFLARDVRAAVVGFAVAVLPLLLFGAYLWSARGSPVYFLTAERVGWQRTFVGPIASFRNSVHAVFWNPYSYSGRFGNLRQVVGIVITAGEIFALALILVVAVWSARRREWGWATFLGLTALALGTSTTYYSVPRMLLSLFPVMLFLAVATRSHRAIYVAAMCVSVVGLCIGTVLFTHGLWFY
jgi:hypothetical protein